MHAGLTAVLILSVSGLVEGAGQQQPARDRAQPAPVGTATISGSVVAEDTGRPVKRARVVVTTAQLGERAAALQGPVGEGGPGLGPMMRGRMQQMGQAGTSPTELMAALRMMQSAQTDDQGHYEIKGLPAGRYAVSASKTGFVAVNFGQRRPLRPGTPIEVREGQQIANVNFSLPRGSVITGRIMDEDGEALARATVTALRYQYQAGERRLVVAGSDQTDDRGQYRIFDLPPGDYYVSGVSRLPGRPGERLAQFMAALGGAPEQEQVPLGYAPTYYPGVTAAAQAARVSVGLAQEMGGVDFQLQLVPMARVSGLVTNPDATPLSAGTVILVPEDSGSAARGGNVTGRVRSDGTFTVEQVPPGRYTLYARNRGGRDEPADYAVVPITVAGQDLPNLAVALAPGATVSGSISFDAVGTQPPKSLSDFRITVPALDPIPFGGNQPLRVEDDGAFSVSGIPAGRHAIRAPGPPRPWALKTVIVDGRDVTDTPLEIRSAQKITQVQVVFTDRVTELAGSVKDGKGEPAFGYTVIAFSTDPTTWRAQSRTIQATQPDQSGAFRLRGLPPGSYFLMATDDVEQGEWFDPSFLTEAQNAAVRVTLSEGSLTSQDLTVREQD